MMRASTIRRQCQRHAARRGISILEVLISIFVMAVGLLGLAALLPLGQFQLARGQIEDNKAAVGQAAMRAIKARRMLDPRRWRTHLGRPLSTLATPSNPSPPGWDHFYGSFAIDPMMIARNPGDQEMELFPAIGGQDLATGNFQGRLGMRRVTLVESFLDSNRRNELQGNFSASQLDAIERALQARFVDEVFIGGDDLLFVRETPPGAVDEVFYQSGAWSPGVLPPASRKRSFTGDYSWMVSVARDAELQDAIGQYSAKRLDYERPVTVSVVVFHKRVTNPVTSEQVVNVDFLGGGWGGGDVLITSLDGTALPSERLRPGQWIMVFADDGPSGRGRPSVTPNHGYFRWYRVASVDDADDVPTERFVTLAGPDWPVSTIQTPYYAALVDGVVGVYEEKMQFEQDSAWTNYEQSVSWETSIEMDQAVGTRGH